MIERVHVVVVHHDDKGGGGGGAVTDKSTDPVLGVAEAKVAAFQTTPAEVTRTENLYKHTKSKHYGQIGTDTATET